jgi:endonuclease III
VLSLVEREVTSPQAVVAHGVDEIKSIIAEWADEKAVGVVGAAICDVADTLLTPAYGGVVPRTRDKLEALKLSPVVLGLLLSHAFAMPEVVVGLHARKIVTALDMVDWEEAGTTMKTKVKMTDLPPSHVKKSLLTWLPPGQRGSFHDLMETVGTIVSDKTCGAWGKLKTCINGAFTAKDKKAITALVVTISQMYRTGRKRRDSPEDPEELSTGQCDP